MANVQELQTAIGEMLVARRNAAYRKRDAGDPRNPFQAKIGLEREFYEASQSVRTYDLILKLLENETKREALKRMRPARVKITKAVDRMVDIYVGAGLIALATLGFAAAFVLLRLPLPAVQAAAFIGVAPWPTRWPGSKSKNESRERRTAMRGPNKKLTPFGKLVVKALADQDMTKAELAAEVGVAPQYLSYILNGTRSGGKYLPAIVAALELDPRKVEKAIAA